MSYDSPSRCAPNPSLTSLPFSQEAGCDCKCREYKFDAEWRACQYCGHSPFQHYSLFNRDIVNPIRKFGYLGAGRTGFLALKRGVLDKALLRRTKVRAGGGEREAEWMRRRF